MAATGTLGFVVAPGVSKPQEREFTVVTTKYAYEPAVIRVNKGDTVRLRFASPDVVHGFYLEGHGIDVKIYPMRANFPTDGLIVEGRTKVNEAMVTGESKPVEKGEPVPASREKSFTRAGIEVFHGRAHFVGSAPWR